MIASMTHVTNLTPPGSEWSDNPTWGLLIHLRHELIEDLQPHVVVRRARLLQEVHDVVHDLPVRVIAQ
jgi:hypothetical protein